MSSLKLLKEAGALLRGPRLSVRTPNAKDAEALASLMRSDEILQKAADMSPAAKKETAAGLLKTVADWRDRRNTLVMAIVNEQDTAIGTISLSHIDEAARTGGIGYWLASSRWGKGYATEAFGLVLGLAAELGLRKVSATIAKDNAASLRIWAKLGATMREKSESQLTCFLEVPVNSSTHAEGELLDEHTEKLLLDHLNDPRQGIELTPEFKEQFRQQIRQRRESGEPRS